LIDDSKSKQELMEELRILHDRIATLVRVQEEFEETIKEEQNLLRAMIDNLPDLIYFKDRMSRFVTVNDAVVRFMGVDSEDELIGKTDAEFYPKELSEKYFSDEQNVMRTGKPLLNMEEKIFLPDGTVRWMQTTKVPLKDGRKRIIGVVGLGRDITNQKNAEENLKRSEERYRTIFENTGTASIIIENNEIISLANEEFERLSGLLREDMEGKVKFTDFIGEETRTMLRDFNKLKIENPSAAPKRFECDFKNKDGEVKQVIMTVELIPGTDRCVASLLDITERKQAELFLQRMATHDELTKLPNRRLFQERLEHALVRAHRHNQLLGVLYLDLDDFKVVNDTYGHEKGDMLLTALGDRLQESVRENDTVARLGGDEFTVILEDAYQLKDIILVARRCIDAVSKPFSLGEHQATVTISVGISVYPTDGSDAGELLMRCDAAMYKAKRQGKNNYQFFSSDIEETH
jgi:diguanylate cyclase (GGDEF)-like protein/PAS domain S-box-containing protein